MASEIRVNKIENRSGLGTVTFADTGVDLAGIVTATTFSGSGASLTDLPAGNLSGTVADARLTTVSSSKLSGALPALDGSALTGVASTDNIRTNTDATFLKGVNVSGVTTTGSVKVGGGVTISESGIEASGIGITVANINGAQIGGRRNIWINGAMNIAQRGTSSTSTGYKTVDRWVVNNSAGTITKAQISLSNSDTGPWEAGMRHALRLTNTSAIGSGAGDYAEAYYRPEAQDLAGSGWDYRNANKFITLSYWARASVAQTYPATIKMGDWDYYFPWNFTIASANVWQKFVIKIPGHASMTINNDNGIGFTMWINAYQGSSYFGSYTANTWNAAVSGKMFAGSSTTTWGTTTGATWDITGFQLEVGSEATPFEHRSFNEEHRMCMRYYEKSFPYATAPANNAGDAIDIAGSFFARSHNNSNRDAVRFQVEKRTAPSLTIYGNSSGYWNSPDNGFAANNNGTNGPDVTGFYPRQQSSGSVIYIQGHYAADAEL